MNIVTRLRKMIAPPCGHDVEIKRLLQEVHDARNAAQAEILRRNAAEREHESASTSYQDSLTVLTEQKRRFDAEMDAAAAANRKLTAELADANQRLRSLRVQSGETRDALEQATSRIAVLEQQIRETGADEGEMAMLYEPSEPTGGAQPDEQIGDDQVELVLALVAIFFDEGRHHWLLASGDARIKAPIHDKDFLASMTRREVSFAAGDAIRARFRLITFRRPGGEGVYAKHSVEKVIAVIKPPAHEQIGLAITGLEEVKRG